MLSSVYNYMSQSLGMKYTCCVSVLRYKMLQRDCNTL